MEARYLRIKNWSNLQHYDPDRRRPPWIKLYNTLLGDDIKFGELGELEQYQLIRIWLVASRSERFTIVADKKGKPCKVPVVADDAATLQRSIMSLKRVPLAKFVREGWLIPVAEDELLNASGPASTVASTEIARLLDEGEHSASAPLSIRGLENQESSFAPGLLALPRGDEAGHEEILWRRLCVAAGARNAQDIGKLERTVRARKSTEREIVCAIDAATGPGVIDPLAVALSELVKRCDERTAA